MRKFFRKKSIKVAALALFAAAFAAPSVSAEIPAPFSGQRESDFLFRQNLEFRISPENEIKPDFEFDFLRRRGFQNGTAEFQPPSRFQSESSSEDEDLDLEIIAPPARRFDQNGEQIDQPSQPQKPLIEFPANPEDFEGRREFLGGAIDLFEARSKILRNQIEKFPAGEQDFENLLSDRENKLNELKNRLEAAESPEEMRSVVDEMRAQDISGIQRKVQKADILNNVGDFESRAIEIISERADKIEERIENLREEGEDTEELSALLEEARGEIDEVEDAIARLKEDVEGEEISKELLDEVKESLGEIKSQIGEIYQIFSEIFEAETNL